MSILKIDHIPTKDELIKLTEEFPDYIKLTADIDKEILYGGSRLHADAEKILLNNGSLQDNIWGGGVNLSTKKIECYAILNIRPEINPDPLILDLKIKEKLINLIKKYFPEFIYG